MGAVRALYRTAPRVCVPNIAQGLDSQTKFDFPPEGGGGGVILEQSLHSTAPPYSMPPPTLHQGVCSLCPALGLDVLPLAVLGCIQQNV